MIEITKDTIIGDILDVAPQTAPIFLSIGMHCLGCPSSRGETVEEACAVHGIDVDKLLAWSTRKPTRALNNIPPANRNAYGRPYAFICVIRRAYETLTIAAPAAPAGGYGSGRGAPGGYRHRPWLPSGVADAAGADRLRHRGGHRAGAPGHARRTAAEYGAAQTCACATASGALPPMRRTRWSWPVWAARRSYRS